MLKEEVREVLEVEAKGAEVVKTVVEIVVEIVVVTVVETVIAVAMIEEKEEVVESAEVQMMQ